MSSTPRDRRRLAFQALFQFDARGEQDAAMVRCSMDPLEDFSAGEKEQAVALALEAYGRRTDADREFAVLAPTWPAHRQAAADRAILRLAHYELTRGGVPVAVVINEAVELAKQFGTDRSPPFVHALLDKVARRLMAEHLVPPGPLPDPPADAASAEIASPVAPPVAEASAEP